MTNTPAPLPPEVEKAFGHLHLATFYDGGFAPDKKRIETIRAHIAALTQENTNLKYLVPEGAYVCCCGDYMIGHVDPYGCGHTPKSQFEWGQQLQEERLKKLTDAVNTAFQALDKIPVEVTPDKMYLLIENVVTAHRTLKEAIEK